MPDNTVSVIDTTGNTVTQTISLASAAFLTALPEASAVYVTSFDNNVVVIGTTWP